jgi:hypothetical protein
MSIAKSMIYLRIVNAVTRIAASGSALHFHSATVNAVFKEFFDRTAGAAGGCAGAGTCTAGRAGAAGRTGRSAGGRTRGAGSGTTGTTGASAGPSGSTRMIDRYIDHVDMDIGVGITSISVSTGFAVISGFVQILFFNDLLALDYAGIDCKLNALGEQSVQTFFVDQTKLSKLCKRAGTDNIILRGIAEKIFERHIITATLYEVFVGQFIHRLQH